MRDFMHTKTFIVNYLPPISLENFKKYSLKEYETKYIKLIEIDNNYYLIKDDNNSLKIKKNFFDFLIEDAIDVIKRDIYVIPITASIQIGIEEININSNIKQIATMYFDKIEDFENFPIPKFLGEEITDRQKNLILKKNYHNKNYHNN